MVALPPMRNTVRAESIAALPPPMIATSCHANLIVPGHRLKERQRRINIVQLRARQIKHDSFQVPMERKTDRRRWPARSAEIEANLC